jgi:hypothetical protein
MNTTAVTFDDLRRALAQRATAYAHFFDVLRERFGTATALEIGREATGRMGSGLGAGFAHLAPDDLQGLKDAFLGGLGPAVAFFQPELQQCDAAELRIQFHACPLKEQWEAMRRTPEDVALLCSFAGAIDTKLFECAGFTFAGETWQPGRTGCCLLKIRPGEAKA